MATLLIVLAAGVSHAQVSAEQTMAIGQDIMTMEDYVLAIQYFNQSIKAKPYLCDPYYLRGLSKMMLEDYSGAEEDCSRAIARNRFKTNPYRIRGFCRLRLNKDSSALQDFKEGLKNAPMDRSLLYYKGIAETRLGMHKTADSTFNNILRYNPKYTKAQSAKIQNMLLAGDTTTALRELDKSIASDRHTATPYIILSRIHANRKNWPTVIDCLNKAIDLDPKNADLYLDRSIARYITGDKKKAISDCAIALDIDPENKRALSANKMLQTDTREISHIFFNATEMDIEHPFTKNKRTGTVFTTDNDIYKPIGFFAFTFTHPYTDLQPATNAYRELNTINTSGQLPSPLYLSHTPGSTPDAEQAVALFAYAESFDANPQTSMTFHNYMGRAVAYTMLKNYEAATADLDKAIALRPDLAAPLLQRAYLHIASAEATRFTGRFHEASLMEAKINEARKSAMADLDTLTAIDPHMPYAWYDKGLILYNTANFTEAAEAFSRAIDNRPDFAEAIFNRALCYARMGDINRAETDFSKAGELGVVASYRILKTLRDNR